MHPVITYNAMHTVLCCRPLITVQERKLAQVAVLSLILGQGDKRQLMLRLISSKGFLEQFSFMAKSF